MKTPKQRRWMGLVCAVVIGLCAVGQGRLIYVDDDAVGGNDGSSWTDAFTYLQDALAVAQAGDEVRVAQGLYRPDQGAGIAASDRDATFSLVSGVILAGGYAGLAGADPEVWDIERYETILSGDLNGDDGPEFTNHADNSRYGVVSSLSNDAATLLEGFTITGGWGDFGSGIRALASDLRMDHCTLVRNKTRGTSGDGAGMYSSGGSPVLKDCVFRDNLAYGNGGGFYSEDGAPVLEDCLFEGNTAERSGGGLYSQEGAVMLERCTFQGNQAHEGAGMHVVTDGESSCVGCRFLDNRMLGFGTQSGGGASVGGTGAMTFRGCVFEGNFAGRGGGLNCGSDFLLSRCRFTDNEADEGGGLYCSYSAPHVTDCQFTGNTARHGGGAAYTHALSRRGGGAPSPGATFVRCRFAGNMAYNAPGGGLYNHYTNVTLLNCLLAGNVASDGGGMFSSGANPTLTHCTLVQNRGGAGGGLLDEKDGTVLDHCIVWDNEGDEVSGATLIAHSDIEGGWPGEGNVDVDPCFVFLGYWEGGVGQRDLRNAVWVDGDYHLRSRAGRWDPESQIWVTDEVSSPCIDAGDPLGSIGDELFPNGGIVNLGAYGGTVEASKSYFGESLCEAHLAGDINGDCRVDFADLLIVVSQWSDGVPWPGDEARAIAIVEPKDGALFAASFEPILVCAEVYDRADAVAGVTFHIEGERSEGHFSTSLAGRKNSNGWWYLEWEALPRRGRSQPEGTYTLTAEAILDDGTSIFSVPVTIIIEDATSSVQ